MIAQCDGLTFTDDLIGRGFATVVTVVATGYHAGKPYEPRFFGMYFGSDRERGLAFGREMVAHLLAHNLAAAAQIYVSSDRKVVRVQS